MRRTLSIGAVVVAALAAVSASAIAAAPAPDATTGAATNTSPHGATLNGTVNPNGSATSYTFQFGPTASYGAETAHGDAGAGTSATPVSATLAGLQSGTTYHYRLVATNSSGTVMGADQTFTTPGTSSKLGYFGHTAFVGPGHVVGIFTGCFGEQICTGSMKLTISGVVLGSRSSFTIRPNNGGIVHIFLNSEGRRRVALARGRIAMRATLTSKDAGTATKVVTVAPFK
jgi:hypothetical protein